MAIRHIAYTFLCILTCSIPLIIISAIYKKSKNYETTICKIIKHQTTEYDCSSYINDQYVLSTCYEINTHVRYNIKNIYYDGSIKETHLISDLAVKRYLAKYQTNSETQCYYDNTNYYNIKLNLDVSYSGDNFLCYNWNMLCIFSNMFFAKCSTILYQ